MSSVFLETTMGSWGNQVTMLKMKALKLKSKLIIAFLMTGIIPLAFVVFFGGRLASDALMEKAFDQLTAVQNIRKHNVELAFKEHFTNLNVLAKVGGIHELLKDIMTVTYGNKDRSLYTGIDFPVNAEAYQSIYDRYEKRLRALTKMHSYKDLYVITPEEGHVIFSLGKGADHGTNLKYGPYKNSSLEKLRQKILQTGEASIVDFERYAPNAGKETAFIGVPIFKSGKITCILALQMSPDLIVHIVQSRKGLGDTGESYFIRWYESKNRFELRSDIQTMGNGRYVIGYERPANLKYWEDAVRNKEGGHDLYVDSTGTSVLAAYNALDIKGIDWYLISKINKEEVLAPFKRVVAITLGIAGILIVVIIVGALLVTATFTMPFIACMQFAKEITRGQFTQTLHLKRWDEIGALGHVLNKMAVSLRKHDWMKVGKEGLDDVMRGEHDTAKLASRFISFISKHLEAQLGSVYLLNDAESLDLIASHAFKDRVGNFNRIPVGEGIVGQVALEKNTILFSNVTDGPVLNYGVGENIPPYFLVAPLVFDESLIGVFLLGSVTPFTELHERFVSETRGNVAILFDAAKSNNTINRLLEESQEHREALRITNDELEEQALILKESEAELQAQQEELRITNEELEEQTRALQQSESELQAQQEELRVTNEELEERTRALEKQKNFIETKNEELSRAQKEVETRAKELEIASKYKSEFLANMSHELRTPLNSILILSQLFSDNKGGNLNEKQIKSAKAINSSGTDLLNLINEILDLSKVESGKLELNVDNTRIEGICSDLKRVFESVAAEKEINFTIEIAGDLPVTMHTDSHRLQQVLRNLLSNAFKFTGRGGNITLKIARPAPAMTKGTKLEPGKAMIFSVEDDGIGIPKEKQLTIFEAFQQADGSTSRKYGGTGLGLSISRELTKLLGGALLLESHPDEGSTFSIVLPEVLTITAADQSSPNKILKGPAAVEIPEQLQAGQENDSVVSDAKISPSPMTIDDRKNLLPGDKTILFIEDDLTFADILRDLAREQGFKTIIAEDGETGLHFADYYKPHAIILDIGLPGIDGWAVMERLKLNPELRHIPVHFMSGTERSLDAMRMGAIGFLTKPVSGDKIKEAFKKIERSISGRVKKMLIVEDDRIQQESIAELIGNNDIEIHSTDSAREAFEILSKDTFDCVILDIGLKGEETGIDLLENIRKSEKCATIPIIVYTGKDLTRDEENLLGKYTKSVIIKGVRSPERLIDETALFLHRIEANLPKSQQQANRNTHNSETVLSGKCILIVDDDMRNVFALSTILEEREIEVLIARDGQEGVTVLEGNSEKIDLILMDIMMPVMDGYEAMRDIRKKTEFKKLPIISLTAKAMRGDRNKCIEAGASDYLAKPLDTDKLLSMLRVWLY